jgi:DNA (cytosine-5)-methyltransferase 1
MPVSALPNGGPGPGASKPTAISMFSGAGGMDLGFMQAGFKIIWAVDWNAFATKTYEKNLELKPLCKNISRVKNFPHADLVIACNPCQGFSIIGKRDPRDSRNYLYREIVRCLRQVRPRYFVVENVKGLTTLYKGKFLSLMLRSFKRAGYNVHFKLLNAKDYGIPQDRLRVFLVGIRKGLPGAFAFPQKTHGPGLKPYVTMKDALVGLPNPAKDDYYDGPFRFYYMSRNRRRLWNEVSYCIQSYARDIPLHPSSPPMIFISRDHWTFAGPVKKYRRLSVRECARLQTFPDDFEFYGPLGSKYRQVGNAVPPKLARILAENLLQFATASVAQARHFSYL